MGRSSQITERANGARKATGTTLKAMVHDVPDRLSDFVGGPRMRGAADMGRTSGEVVVEKSGRAASALVGGAVTLMPLISKLLRRKKVRTTALVAARSHPLLLGGAVAVAIGGFLLARRRQQQVAAVEGAEVLEATAGIGATPGSVLATEADIERELNQPI